MADSGGGTLFSTKIGTHIIQRLAKKMAFRFDAGESDDGKSFVTVLKFTNFS